MVAQLHGTMIKMENFQKLHELKKDLIGIDNLVIPGRVGTRCRVMSADRVSGLEGEAGSGLLPPPGRAGEHLVCASIVG